MRAAGPGQTLFSTLVDILNSMLSKRQVVSVKISSEFHHTPCRWGWCNQRRWCRWCCGRCCGRCCGWCGRWWRWRRKCLQNGFFANNHRFVCTTGCIIPIPRVFVRRPHNNAGFKRSIFLPKAWFFRLPWAVIKRRPIIVGKSTALFVELVFHFLQWCIALSRPSLMRCGFRLWVVHDRFTHVQLAAPTASATGFAIFCTGDFAARLLRASALSERLGTIPDDVPVARACRRVWFRESGKGAAGGEGRWDLEIYGLVSGRK